MSKIILASEVFSCFIMGIILYASILESTKRTLKNTIFSVFAATILLLTFSDGVSWMLDGSMDMRPIANITITLSIIGVYPVAVLFGEYLTLHYAERGKDVSKLQRLMVIYGVTATIVALVGCITGHLFVISDGFYHDGDYYGLYIVSMLPMYVLQYIMMLRGWKIVSMHDNVAFFCYALMPILCVIIGFLYPDSSFSYPALCVSTLMVYVMLQSGQQQAAEERASALLEKSYTDDLTGILNRRAYTQTCSDISAEEWIGVAFCDVNGLKYINDHDGHATGDMVLQHVAEQMCSCVGNEQLYRVSGDEFVIILRGCAKGEIEHKAEELAALLRKGEYDPVAIGTAEGNGSELIALQSRAEEAMYAAKTLFHRKFPEYVRGGDLFIRDIVDDREDTSPETDLAEVSEDVHTSITRETRRLLLVDSNSDARKLLKTLLADEYRILEAGNITDAIQTLKANARSVSLVLLNAREPELSGVEFMRELQADSQTKTIPVILTSEELTREAEKKYLRLGVYDCLVRPYSPDKLLNRIRRSIELRESVTVLADIKYDELTGLYTRRAFFHHMQQTMVTGDTDVTYDLTVLDIPDFKGINRRFGENRGDEVLRHIANCIRESMDTINARYGRYGADVFMILAESGVFDEAQREALARRIETTAPVPDISVKFGVYDHLPSALPSSIMCDRAIAAVSTIKHRYGIRTAMYDREIQKALYRDQQLEADMEKAVREKQFRVYYQTKHDAQTGKLVGAEALVRWQHPTLGFLMPGEFIGMFERNGFIRNVDRYVWTQTCENLGRWRAEGIPTVPISVNTSRLDFAETEYFDKLDVIRAENDIPSNLLHIEVTESAFADCTDTIREIINTCRNRGYKIEIDDFGAGFSSLNALGTLSVDVVKLDRQLTTNASGDRSAQVLASCIALAHRLKLSVIAEGVETKDQLDMLRFMECDQIQGYYFSKPMPEEVFEEYLKRRQ